MHHEHGPTGDPLRNLVALSHGRREVWASYPGLSSPMALFSAMEDEAHMLEAGRAVSKLGSASIAAG